MGFEHMKKKMVARFAAGVIWSTRARLRNRTPGAASRSRSDRNRSAAGCWACWCGCRTPFRFSLFSTADKRIVGYNMTIVLEALEWGGVFVKKKRHMTYWRGGVLVGYKRKTKRLRVCFVDMLLYWKRFSQLSTEYCWHEHDLLNGLTTSVERSYSNRHG